MQTDLDSQILMDVAFFETINFGVFSVSNFSNLNFTSFKAKYYCNKPE